MLSEFPYDVFLSHSAKDKAAVRPLAERLRQDGLKAWFDEWEIAKAQAAQRQTESDPQPSAFSLQHLVEEGLEHSRVLVLCMSANAFGSDWAQLEAGMASRLAIPFCPDSSSGKDAQLPTEFIAYPVPPLPRHTVRRQL